MANYKIKIDLLKLNGAFVKDIQGETTTKRCLCLPLDDASLYAGKKGIYLNLTAFETQNPQYGDTHYLKANLTYDQYQALSEEERKNRPIVGNMGERLQATEQASPATDNTNVNTSSEDDLPF